MANSAVNLDINNNADGFDLTGGTTPRKLDVSGSDIIIVGSGAFVITFPAATSTLATLGENETFTGAKIFTGGMTLGVDGTISSFILTEKASIALDPAGGADGDYSGITIAGTGGAVIAFGEVVYLAVGDSRWELADADAVATAGTIILGICVLASTDGGAITVLLNGTIRADSLFPALTIGAKVYVSTTPGAIQVAAPTGTDDVIRVAGFALTADEIYFAPSPSSITHV